jgi:hypothetical protein
MHISLLIVGRLLPVIGLVVSSLLIAMSVVDEEFDDRSILTV